MSDKAVYAALVAELELHIPQLILGSFKLDEAMIWKMPEQVQPKAQQYVGYTFTCFAIPIIEESLWIWFRHGDQRYLFANYLLEKAGQQAVRLLHAHGYEGWQQHDLFGQSMALVEVGVLAGLGTRGWNNLLLHPVYGSWIQLHCVVHNLPVKPSLHLAQSVCIHCSKCIDACPVRAVARDDFHAAACSRVVASPTSRKSKAIALTENSYIECRECIEYCPIGTPTEGILSWR